MKKIRVLIADDHPGVRTLLRTLLCRANDIDVVGEAKDGAEALRLVEQLIPDVLLLDIEMPGMTGIDVALELQARQSPVVVLAVSAYNDRHYIKRMLATGAAGYLVKDDVPKNLIAAVREVAQGKRGWLVQPSMQLNI